MSSLDSLFCDVDDFCLVFEPEWQKKLINYGEIKLCRGKSLCSSERITILMLLDAFASSRETCPTRYFAFHQHDNCTSCFVKTTIEILGISSSIVSKKYWHSNFLKLISYKKFVKLIPSILNSSMGVSQTMFCQLYWLLALLSQPVSKFVICKVVSFWTIVELNDIKNLMV